MEKEKVSIITAVYKAEEFLTRCVNSILNQTYQNLELLLIDDGSPDNCPQMCDEFAKKDTRIRVIHKVNGGVSSAWNAGLDHATGDYIAFVDSDDWVEPTYIEKLYEIQQKYHSDIAICCNDIVNGNVHREDKDFLNVTMFYPSAECLNIFFAEKRWRHAVWAKLYKKEIFKNLRYPEDIKCVEDTYMLCDLCQQIKNGVATTAEVLYHYVIQNQSVSRTVSEKRFDGIKARRHVLEQLKPQDNAYVFAVRDLFVAYKTTYRLFKHGKRKDLIQQLNVWFKEDYQKYVKYTKGLKRLKNFVFRYFRPLFDLGYLIKRK